MTDVKEGSTVSVHYTGKFEDGKVFDSSEGRDPLSFQVGSGMMIKGFDEAVRGMKTGEEKEITLSPEDAYGQRNEQMVQEVPKNMFPGNMELKVGMNLVLKSPDGQQMMATIQEIGEEKVKIDLNHPLAGKKLLFKIKVVDIK